MCSQAAHNIFENSTYFHKVTGKMPEVEGLKSKTSITVHKKYNKRKQTPLKVPHQYGATSQGKFIGKNFFIWKFLSVWLFLAGVELIFFPVSITELCFEFVASTGVIIQRGF